MNIGGFDVDQILARMFADRKTNDDSDCKAQNLSGNQQRKKGQSASTSSNKEKEQQRHQPKASSSASPAAQTSSRGDLIGGGKNKNLKTISPLILTTAPYFFDGLIFNNAAL